LDCVNDVFKEQNPTTKALEKLHLQCYNNKSYAQETAFYNITTSQNKSLRETFSVEGLTLKPNSAISGFVFPLLK
jgi:hypothetical protein